MTAAKISFLGTSDNAYAYRRLHCNNDRTGTGVCGTRAVVRATFEPFLSPAIIVWFSRGDRSDHVPSDRPLLRLFPLARAHRYRVTVFSGTRSVIARVFRFRYRRFCRRARFHCFRTVRKLHKLRTLRDRRREFSDLMSVATLVRVRFYKKPFGYRC